MKKKLWMAAVAALGLAAVSQAGTIVYQSDFTGSDLGSGLASAGAATDIWSLNAANDRAEFNDGDDVQNSRASLYTTSSYQSTGGFKLDVTFYQAATDLNTFSIALVDADDSDLSYIVDTINKSMPVYSVGFTASGQAATDNGGPGLVLNDGTTAKNTHTAMEYLSNSQTYNNAAEQTLSMTVTATGWSYSLNGAAATTGSFTFDTTKNYEVVGFIQGNNSDPDNVDGAYFSNITLTTIPEPATLGLVGTFGIAIMFIRRLRV
jgi:hypothetical protein